MDSRDLEQREQARGYNAFLGGVLDLVLDYNKEQEKKVHRSFLVKHYGCLAPGAMSTLS